MSPLPGADKYLTAEKSSKSVDPRVQLANDKVRIEEVLTKYFNTYVPYQAHSWKVRCPFFFEHDDGGIDRQFRVYSATNTGYCFALHGTLTPVRLWSIRGSFRTQREAATALLDTFGVSYREPPYWERVRGLQETIESRPVADPQIMVQAIQYFLRNLEGYEAHQYDTEVLLRVNSILGEVHSICAEARSVEEVEQWYQAARDELRRTISQSFRSG